MDGEKLQKQVDHIEEAVDTLARAVLQGFEEVHSEFAKVRTEMQEGFTSIRSEMATKVEMAKGFEGVNARIEGINRRIDNEADQRVELGLRVEKVEAKVFPELQRQ
jgi:tetrahydromethanopterin S-methyltransferase subunit G